MFQDYLTEENKVKKEKVHQFDISFMRVCTNKAKKDMIIEDEKEMSDVMVDVSLQDKERIITLFFLDCEDEDYLHLKQSIEYAKQDNPFDYEAKDNSYMFRLEFDSEKEISCGGDLCATKSKCYIDETNNAIVFMGK